MHYGVKGNAGLGHPVRDADGGFALAPMSKGVRLTTVSSSLIATHRRALSNLRAMNRWLTTSTRRPLGVFPAHMTALYGQIARRASRGR
jgi:hypothetical protein